MHKNNIQISFQGRAHAVSLWLLYKQNKQQIIVFLKPLPHLRLDAAQRDLNAHQIHKISKNKSVLMRI